MKPKEPIEIMMHNHTDAVLPECSESIVLAYSAKSSQMCACFSILTNTRGYPPQASYLELYFFFCTSTCHTDTCSPSQLCIFGSAMSPI